MPESVTLDRPIHLLREGSRNSTAPTSPVQKKCSACRVSLLCLPGGLRECDLRPLDALSLTTRTVKPGQTVYRDGDPFRFIYAVRRGTCKTSLTAANGREQVADFHMAGEVMGLEGLAHDVHGTTATALEESEVCLIPYRRLASMTAANPGTQDLLSHLMSREIVRGNSLMALLGPSTAANRLAAFLLNLSQRYAARGYSPRDFYLHMTRGEIGSYLGIGEATVSRMFSLFQRRGFVKVQARRVGIIDLDGFQREYDLRIA